MSVQVCIYDDSCFVLRHSLDIIAESAKGIVLDSGTATTMGADWGCSLSWIPPGSSPNVYKVLIDDPSGKALSFSKRRPERRPFWTRGCDYLSFTSAATSRWRWREPASSFVSSCDL